MKKFTKVLSTIAIAAISVGAFSTNPASAVEFKIKNNHVKFNQNRYFKRNATALKIGSYGKKRTPVGGKNYLEGGASFDAVGPRDQSPGHVASSDSDFSSDIDLSSESQQMNIDINAMINLVRSQACTFKRVWIGDKYTLMENINNNPTMIERLKYDNSNRIVFDILRVDECNIANSTTVGSGATVSNGAAKGSINVSSTTNNQFEFGTGSVIGYRLYKIEWDKSRKKKRTRIIGLREDSKGLN